MKTNTGVVFEGQIKSALQSKGFAVISHSDYIKNPDKYTGNILLTNYSYGKTIFDKQGSVKFLLISPSRGLRVAIECKWQQGSGSTEHKIPYVYLNLLESVPEDEIIIIIDGDGWSKGIVSWLKNAASSNKYAEKNSESKNIRILNLKEFITWVNDTFTKEKNNR